MAAALAPALAPARAYPSKTVKIVAAVQPGGGVDLVAACRDLADAPGVGILVDRARP
jgi:tripartite-type tricarboxylate transporter receptor subunit TctC